MAQHGNHEIACILKSMNEIKSMFMYVCVSRYLFLIGVNHASISLPVLTTVLDRIKNTVTQCCSSADVTACLTEKVRHHYSS